MVVWFQVYYKEGKRVSTQKSILSLVGQAGCVVDEPGTFW